MRLVWEQNFQKKIKWIFRTWSVIGFPIRLRIWMVVFAIQVGAIKITTVYYVQDASLVLHYLQQEFALNAVQISFIMLLLLE